MYGRPPPHLLLYELGSTVVQVVEEEMKSWDFVLTLVHENLLEAQSKMKHYADKKRIEREFNIEDWAYLWLRPYDR